MFDDSFFTQLPRIIDQQDISVVFQPIFDISQQRIYGYEALSRGPVDSELHLPQDLFRCAESCGLLSDLELVCRKQAIHRYVEQELNGLLFLNVSPQVLLDSQHPKGETLQLLRYYGLEFERVVIEITEQHKVDSNLLRQAVNYYRGLGFTIALDDIGGGHSGLRQWSELMPDIVKIDHYFVHNCHIDGVKKAFLRSLITLAQETNCLLIAEGIEHPGEFKLLNQLGFEFTQGFLLEKPSATPSRVLPIHVNELLGRFSVDETSTVRSPMRLRQF